MSNATIESPVNAQQQSPIPKKKNVGMVAFRGLVESILATVFAETLVGKSKTFLRKENLKDTVITFGTSLAFIGLLDISKAVEHNKEIDSFAERAQREKNAAVPGQSL